MRLCLSCRDVLAYKPISGLCSSCEYNRQKMNEEYTRIHKDLEEQQAPQTPKPTRDAEIAAMAERIFERHYPKWQENHAMQLHECASDAIFAAVEFFKARDEWMEARRDG